MRNRAQSGVPDVSRQVPGWLAAVEQAAGTAAKPAGHGIDRRLYNAQASSSLCQEEPNVPKALSEETPRLYDDEGDLLMEADQRSDRVVLLPSGDPRRASPERDRIRIQWGQHLLADLLASRYRSLVCGVNTEDNEHGIITQVVSLTATSQWTPKALTSYARMFSESVSVHAATDREPYVLKYDLDSLLVLALLRPVGQDHFTLEDLSRGFATVGKMLRGRRERLPVASVSFLGAKSNRLVGPEKHEPTFESVIRVMHDAGYRGDVYPSLGMWELAPTGVFASYPFPESLNVMRKGGF